MAIERPLRGILFNLDHGLMLPFQLNPMGIRITKNVKYGSLSVPGWETELPYFTGGGALTVSMNLYFDSSAGARTVPGLHPARIPGVGLLGVEAVLQAFLYPRNALSGTPAASVIQRVGGLIQRPNKRLPPPVCNVLFGARFWRTFLNSLTINEEMHDKVLNPRHISAQLSFTVIEAGAVWKQYSETQGALSVITSGLGVAGTTVNLLTDPIKTAYQASSLLFGLAELGEGIFLSPSAEGFLP